MTPSKGPTAPPDPLAAPTGAPGRSEHSGRRGRARRPRAGTAPPEADERAPLPAPLTPSGDLERVDALTRYMAQLRGYAPISREQERELAIRWVEHGDTEAARRLVFANLRLVVKIAMEYRRSWTQVLDLIQEGNVGLLEAVQRFDPYQDVKLSSYAAYWIRAYILKYLLDNIRMVRLGTTRAQRKLFFRLNREKRELERRGFEVEPKLIAERLEVSEDDVVEMEQRLAHADLSLDAPVGDGDDAAPLGEFLAATPDSAEQTVAAAQLQGIVLEQIEPFARDLDARDRRIIEERILADEPKTLQELGDEFGISRERVRQLEARLVKLLRDHFREHLVDFEYYDSGGRG